MWYFVTVVFDEEHRNTTSVNASSESTAKKVILSELHMTEQDVISIEVTRAIGMDETKTRADYAKYGLGPKI